MPTPLCIGGTDLSTMPCVLQLEGCHVNLSGPHSWCWNVTELYGYILFMCASTQYMSLLHVFYTVCRMNWWMAPSHDAHHLRLYVLTRKAGWYYQQKWNNQSVLINGVCASGKDAMIIWCKFRENSISCKHLWSTNSVSTPWVGGQVFFVEYIVL